MCGFTGFYGNKTNKSRTELQVIGKRMTETLAHRGPDSAGTWQDPDIPLLLGHQRLAIIDLSSDGHQPMASASERYMIAYNGEIYNYLDLQKQLQHKHPPPSREGFRRRVSDADHNTNTQHPHLNPPPQGGGHSMFKGRSDTEIMLAAIETWGLNQALQKFNGMFAFALWDRKNRSLHLVRDRLGKKPLYVGWAGTTLVFGSELKALRAHPDFTAEVNRETLSLYMRYGHVPAPHSIYQNVWQLPAGFRLDLNLETLEPGENLEPKMEAYWNHLRVLEQARAHPTHKSEAEIIDEFEALLETCVKDRMISDVPLGAFLSGGIDSSAIAALMQKGRSQPIKTYTIGFEEAGYNEAEYAKKIAAHLGTDHHELYLSGEDALDTIPLLPTMYDEPFADISAIPTYLVSKFAHRDVTVALSGDGGDEMLGGYNRHIMGPKIWKRIRSMPKPLRSLLSGTIHKVPTATWDKLVCSQPQFGARIHKAASVLSLNTQDEIFQRLITQWDHNPVIDGGHASALMDRVEWQPQENNERLSFAEMMMYKDALSYLPNNILTKVDRASMAVSLEARAPLLDHRIYEYVWSLPENMKLRGGQGKYLLRQTLARHIPAELFERPKQGFNMPASEWLRGPLKGWAENLLDEKALKDQGYLNPAAIRQTWDAHQNGAGNHAQQLWTVLMFQAWADKWL